MLLNAQVDKIDRGKLDLRPAYQREYVWSIKTASKLIESLLLNIPVPTLFFNELGAGTLEVCISFALVWKWPYVFTISRG